MFDIYDYNVVKEYVPIPIEKHDTFIGYMINATLVVYQIRPAMLFQYVDFDEMSKDEPISSAILSILSEEYSHLIFTQMRQGTLISLAPVLISRITNEKLGELLGYPCRSDFDYIKEDESTFSISLYANVTDQIIRSTIELFANVCKDESKLSEFQQIASNANQLLEREHNSILDKINSFGITSSFTPSILFLYEKLLSGNMFEEASKASDENGERSNAVRPNALTNAEQEEASNYLWNVGMVKTAKLYDSKPKTRYANGALMYLLLLVKYRFDESIRFDHDLLRTFDKQVYKILKQKINLNELSTLNGVDDVRKIQTAINKSFDGRINYHYFQEIKRKMRGGFTRKTRRRASKTRTRY